MTPPRPTPLSPAARLFARLRHPELLSSYAVSIARVASWAVVGGLIYRVEGAVAFAAFALVRSLVTVINYTSLGIAPALIVLLPQFRVTARPAETVGRPEESEPTGARRPLDYSTLRGPQLPPATPVERLVNNALLVSGLPFAALLIGMMVVQQNVPWRSHFWSDFRVLGWPLGVGACIRVIGDIAGAHAQVTRRLVRDNIAQLAPELIWVGLLLSIRIDRAQAMMGDDYLQRVGTAGVIAACAGVFVRYSCSGLPLPRVSGQWSWAHAKLLLVTGFGILLGQLADLLYAPVNQLIIKRFAGAEALAVYAPTLLLDAALLLGVGGLSTLLLPKASRAFAVRDVPALRRYYVQGTLGSLFLLTAGAVVVVALDQWVFRLWFGDPMPATQAILPFVLIHTVVGGAAGVGRSILVGIGKAKPYAMVSISAGVLNVGLALLLVQRWGILGIVAATVATVTLRCALWMPWYTLRTLRHLTPPVEPVP